MDFYDISIELSKLHIEFVKQVKLYEYWSNKLTKTTTEKDNAKKQLEEHEAHLDLFLRKNWDQEHPEIKLTESSIKSAIKTDKEYIQYYEEYLKKVAEFTNAVNIKNTLEQRKAALENSVKLYTAGYFTTQHVDKEVEEYFGTSVKQETEKELESNERMKKLKKKRSG